MPLHIFCHLLVFFFFQPLHACTICQIKTVYSGIVTGSHVLCLHFVTELDVMRKGVGEDGYDHWQPIMSLFLSFCIFGSFTCSGFPT